MSVGHAYLNSADVTVEAGDPDTTYHLEWMGERRSQDVRLVEADGGN